MHIKGYLKGLLLVALVAAASMAAQNVSVVKSLNFSSLIIAIFIGATIKNLFGVKESMNAGIKFASKRLLRLAIILLGFKLSLAQIADIGPKAFLLIVIVTTLTLIFTKRIGRKFSIPEKRAILIGSGISICGASAVAAVNGVIKSDDEDVAFAIGIVTVFGTLFMLVYPLFFNLLHLDASFYSLWAGSSIHEVAQVVAAGFAASNEAGTYATLVKLTRVLFIIPVTVYLSISEIRKNKEGEFSWQNISIPWFVILFLGVVTINSTVNIPQKLLNGLIVADNIFMTAAMAGLGLEISIANMKKVGLKPLYLGAAASLFISVLSAVVIGLFGIA